VGTPAELVVLIPVFNDWQAVLLLLNDIDLVLASRELSAEVVLVDDGSTVVAPEKLSRPLRAIAKVDILHLRRNLGHQRAIALGLAYLHAARKCRAIVVMDGDGEDRPSDILELLARFEAEEGRKIVFAARLRRSESLLFRLFYRLYRLMHRVLTGISVQVGNFSLIPAEALETLVVTSELWNHYAASVFRTHLPFCMIPTSRGSRLAGRSRLNFIGLVLHGLSAISVFGDVVGARLLYGVVAFTLILFGALSTALGFGVLGGSIRLGWAVYGFALLSILLVQTILMAFLLVFIILNGRANLTFVPVRDHPHFIKTVTSLPPP
jgi:glycosyltransferase involved in cell wall biosynthesis